MKDSITDTKKVFKSGAFAGIMQMFWLGLRYLYAIIAIRIFGAANFGIFILGRTVSEFTALFAGLGLNQGLIRHIPHYKAKNDNETISSIISFSYRLTIIVSLIAAGLLFLLSDFIAEQIFKEPNLAIGLKYICISIPFIAVIKIYYSILRGFKDITKRVLIESGILPLLLVVNVYLFSFIEENYLGLIFAYLAANIEATIVATFMSRIFKFLDFKSKLKRETKKEVTNYSWPLLLSSSIEYLQKYTDTLMLGILSSVYNVGVYTIALRISAFIAIPLASFNMLFAPLIAEIYEQKDTKRLKDNYINITKLTLTASLPILGVIILYPSQLLAIFGKGFENVSVALIIISFGQLINVGVGATGQILIMTGNQRISLNNSIVFLIITIALNLVFIPKLGVIGAGIANCISLSSLNITRLVQIKKYINILPLDKTFIKPVGAFSISFFLIFLGMNFFSFQINQYLIALFGTILFLSIYILLLVVFGFEEFEKIIIRKVLENIKYQFNN